MSLVESLTIKVGLHVIQKWWNQSEYVRISAEIQYPLSRIAVGEKLAIYHHRNLVDALKRLCDASGRIRSASSDDQRALHRLLDGVEQYSRVCGPNDCSECEGYGWFQCSDCYGSGLENGDFGRCHTCDKSGVVACAKCHGRGIS